MKKLVIFFAVIIFIGLFPINIFAQQGELEQEFLEKNGEQLENAIVNEEAQDFLLDKDFSLENIGSMANFSITEVFSYIFDEVKELLSVPVKIIAVSISVIVLLAIFQSMNTINSNEKLSKIVDIIGIIFSISVMYGYISQSIDLTIRTLEDSSFFIMSFTPIFASVIGAGGSITSAGIYNSIILLVANFVSRFASSVILPFLSIYMSISIVEIINPAFNLSGFSNGIKRAVQWAIGLIMTIFVGMITLQSIVGVSADSLSIRTGKFMASSFIPLVGGAISEAYTTVKGSLGVLRSGVGTFGIITILLIIVPPILYVFAVKLAVYLSSIIADVLGVKKIAEFMKNVSSVLAISISLMVCFGLIIIISTTIVMMMTMNIAA